MESGWFLVIALRRNAADLSLHARKVYILRCAHRAHAACASAARHLGGVFAMTRPSPWFKSTRKQNPPRMKKKRNAREGNKTDPRETIPIPGPMEDAHSKFCASSDLFVERAQELCIANNMTELAQWLQSKHIGGGSPTHRMQAPGGIERVKKMGAWVACDREFPGL